MDKSFVDYFKERDSREYEFKAKFAVCDEPDVAKIKKYLEKFEFISLSDVRRTPIQESPLDFPSIKNSEVFILDLSVKYPVTPDALRRELAQLLGYSEMCVSIRSKKDTRDEELNPMKSPYVPALGSEPKFDKEPEYGQKVIDGMVAQIKDREQTKPVTNKLIPDQVVDKKAWSGDEKGQVGTKSVFNNPDKLNKPVVKKNTYFSKNV